MNRVLIIGGPKTGKSTLGSELSQRLGLKLISTDDYIGRKSFKGIPDAILADHGSRDNIIIEGVAAARLLTRDYKPDLVIYLTEYSADPKHVALNTIARTRYENYKGEKVKLGPRPDLELITTKLSQLIGR